MESLICSNINCDLKGQEQPLNHFYFRSDTKKYRDDCKECCKRRSSKNHLNNREERLNIMKNHYTNNREELNKKNKNWYYLNIEKRKEYEQIRSRLPERIKYQQSLNKLRYNGTGTGQSKEEKFIEEFLIKNQIPHGYNYSEQKCRSIKNVALQFDFYLPTLNTFIEFDGIYHFKPIFGEDVLNTFKSNDQIKSDYCQQNNINLIRITYLQDLEQELSKLLIKIAA